MNRKSKELQNYPEGIKRAQKVSEEGINHVEIQIYHQTIHGHEEQQLQYHHNDK